MLVGSANCDITPKSRIPIAGQMNVRYGEYTHDPLTINAVAFKRDGNLFVIVSCDFVGLPEDLVNSVKEKLAKKYNCPTSSFNIAAVHTHLAPYTYGMSGICDIDEDYIAFLKSSLLDVVDKAINNLEECKVFAGSGYLKYMGFNRRGRKKDGSVDMYYGSWNDDFVGLEGPRDGEVGVIFVKTLENKLKAVIPNFSTHPNSVEGESYYSADVVGATRKYLRAIYGDDLDICYLTGAAGNTAPSDLYNKDFVGYFRNEEGLQRSGVYLASEIAKVICETFEPMESDVLTVREIILPVKVREYPEDFDIENTFAVEHFTAAKKKWPEILAKSPINCNITVARIGDAVICTNPAELYVEFGLDIKRESPAKVTLISELTNGCIGYVAIPEAYKNGGYSAGWPSEGSIVEPDTGYNITRETKKMLYNIFD